MENIIRSHKVGGAISGFDVLKLFMAMMIVANHSQAYMDPAFRLVFWPFIRVAVPVFFVLSSLFYFKKQRTLHYDFGAWIHFTKRILKLYVFWLVINTPFIIFSWRVDFIGNNFVDNVYIFLKLCLFYQLTGFPGSWFFSALVWAITIFTVLKKIKVPDIMLFLIALLSYIFVWFPDYLPGYARIIYDSWYNSITPRVNLTMFVAIPWCFIGYIITNPKIWDLMESIKEMKSSRYVIPLIAIILYAVLALLNGDRNDYAWWNIGWAPLLIVAFFFIEFPQWKGYSIMRNLSVLLYMIHFVVVRFVRAIPFESKVTVYVVTLAVSLALGYAILKLEKYRSFRWLCIAH